MLQAWTQAVIRPIELKHRHLWGKKVAIYGHITSKTDYQGFDGTPMYDLIDASTGKPIFEVVYIYEVEPITA